jgi:DNA-binding response OmpR family regulator
MVEKMQKKVLIIEDDVNVMKVLMTRLSDEGFSVLAATTGEEGLKMALSEHPNIILIDIILPKMNGIEVVEQLRNDAWGKEARIIAVSNLTDQTSMRKMEKMNVIKYIVKTDLSVEKLIEVVKKEVFS